VAFEICNLAEVRHTDIAITILHIHNDGQVKIFWGVFLVLLQQLLSLKQHFWSTLQNAAT